MNYKHFLTKGTGSGSSLATKSTLGTYGGGSTGMRDVMAALEVVRMERHRKLFEDIMRKMTLENDDDCHPKQRDLLE